ncbi:MAG: hypothetical protein M3Q31_02905, partial [Actinomycetota bacterium]|nr:hypothetical protein [Actinomycetota bacterium]
RCRCTCGCLRPLAAGPMPEISVRSSPGCSVARAARERLDRCRVQKSPRTNMFAAHFLTDALAAGHLINKTEVMEQAKASWNKLDKTARC